MNARQHSSPNCTSCLPFHPVWFLRLQSLWMGGGLQHPLPPLPSPWPSVCCQGGSWACSSPLLAIHGASVFYLDWPNSIDLCDLSPTHHSHKWLLGSTSLTSPRLSLLAHLPGCLLRVMSVSLACLDPDPVTMAASAGVHSLIGMPCARLLLFLLCSTASLAGPFAPWSFVALIRDCFCPNIWCHCERTTSDMISCLTPFTDSDRCHSSWWGVELREDFSQQQLACWVSESLWSWRHHVDKRFFNWRCQVLKWEPSTLKVWDLPLSHMLSLYL